MNEDTQPVLNLDVELEYDGNYWIARCPALRMAAAHRRKSAAWMRALRMFPAQIVYALNHDPALTSLIAPEYPEVKERLQDLKTRGSFTLAMVSTGARAEIPDFAVFG